MDRSRIEVYAAGGQKLAQAYWGLTQEQLLRKPADGSWSLHQIALHMMDSDMIATDRMKRIASMQLPLLVGYDETGFANLPGSEKISAFQAIELFQKNRQLTAVILRSLPDASYQRCGIHTEAGKVSLGELIEKYIAHLEHHLQFVERKRKLLTEAQNGSLQSA